MSDPSTTPFFEPEYDAADAVAVVALAGRFPGADSVEDFWQLLLGQDDAITRFSRDRLLAAGVAPELVDDPRFVAARGVLEGVENFDAELFSIAPREAALVDPQHRIFLELAWTALELAGWDPLRAEVSGAGRVGVFAGTTGSTYLLHNLFGAQHGGADALAPGERWQAGVLNQKSALPTRVSYKLGLSGPSLAVASACSSSLLAVHMGCQALLDYHCDTVLAGGVTVRLPQVSGHLHLPGGIHSGDGRCRPYDADAAGTVFGDGAGVVVLRRLEDALAAGDSVRAVIRGSAVNNDGAVKAGFTAPGLDGQEAVIRRALDLAEVDPATVGMVEGHGTATALGDPLEVRALSRAYRAAAAGELAPESCLLTSLKGHVGHLDAAAGIAGMIKGVLAVERGTVPPTLGFQRSNPEIDFASTPFFASGAARPWPQIEGPRRAGVSAFGIGGTNVHLVLEQAPPAARPPDQDVPPEPALLLLSARSDAGLAAHCRAIGTALEGEDAAPREDAAYTLAQGRHAFPWRRTVVLEPGAAVVPALEAAARRPALAPVPSRRTGPAPSVAFLLPGQGSQHPAMGESLWRRHEGFRQRLEGLLDTVRSYGGPDLEPLLFPRSEEHAAATAELRKTQNAQPALVAVELAVAGLWEQWGVVPSALLGHSVGEWSAACLAGVMTPRQALRLVTVRGRLVAGLAPGAMLAVPLPARRVREALERRDGDELELAAINAEDACVISGPGPAVAAFADELAADGVAARALHTSHAFHSRALDAVLPAFQAEVAAAGPLKVPRVPFVSNVTGTWIRPDEATDPAYWARQLRAPVRFAEGLEAVSGPPPEEAGVGVSAPGVPAGAPTVLLEVGPGTALTSLARRHPRVPAAIASWPHPRDADTTPADRVMLAARGRLWSHGVEAAVADLFPSGRRCSLPPTPFERRRHWIAAREPRREASLLASSLARGPARDLVTRLAALPANDERRQQVDKRLAALLTEWELAAVLPRAPEVSAGPTGSEATSPAASSRTCARASDPVARVVGDVLGVAAVGDDDDFFELGGDSLLALRVAGRLTEVLGHPVEAGDLFQAPRLGDLRVRLGASPAAREQSSSDGASTDADAAVEGARRVIPPGSEMGEVRRRADPTAPAPLTFAQRRLWVLDQLEPGNAAHHLPAAVRLGGRLVPRWLASGLAAVVERHGILRTTFPAEGAGEGLGEPRQVVGAFQGGVPLPVVDLSGIGARGGGSVEGADAIEAVEAELTGHLARAFLRRPFDLQRGPLLRSVLLRRRRDHALILSLHHIVADGLSLGRLLEEMATVYSGLSGDGDGALAPLPLQYADYAAWQRQRWESGAFTAPLEAWRRHLTNHAGGLELPADRPRPALQSFDGARAPLTFSAATAAGAAALARRRGMTLFSVLWASFAATLWRFVPLSAARTQRGSGGGAGPEVVIGTPVSGRHRRELEPLVGLFLETWVLRLPLAPEVGAGSSARNLSLDDLLVRAGGELADAKERGPVPFERLVEALAPERDLSRNPLFQILFALLETPLASYAAGEMTLDPEPVDPATAQLDLTVNLVLRPGDTPRLEGWVEYATALYDLASIARFTAAWRCLLTAALEEPGRPVTTLPLVSAAQRHQLLLEMASPVAPPPALDGLTLGAPDALEPVIVTVARRAAEAPERPAVLPAMPSADPAAPSETPAEIYPGAEGDGHRTYGELLTAVAAVARRLLLAPSDGPAESTVPLETPVIVALPPGGDAAVALLGSWRAGLTVVPVDPGHPAARLAGVLENSGARRIITSAAGLETLRRDLEGLGLAPERVPALEAVEDLMDPGTQRSMQISLPPPDPQRLAYILYTSGSTGRPKGVAVTHRTLARFLAAMAEGPGRDLLAAASGGSLSASMPTLTTLAFDISLLEHFLPLTLGAALRPVPREIAADGQRLATWLEAAAPAAIQATPATWRMLRAAQWWGHPDLVVLCGGEALPRALARELTHRPTLSLAGAGPEGTASGGGGEGVATGGECLRKGRRLWNLYGPTETTVWSAAGVVLPSDDADAPVPLGPPLPATRLYALDDDLRPVPLGAVGELWIAGDGLARGYHRLPARTAVAFRPHPFPQPPAPASPQPSYRGPGARIYRTGDLVRRRHDGQLDFLGRRDFQVKVRGFRIELGEIEGALESLDTVRVAAVTARRDEVGHRLVAHVVLAAGNGDVASASGSASLSTRAAELPGQLSRSLQQQLPAYMVPAVFDILDALPLNASGKVDRRALGERAVAGQSDGPRTAPETPAERALAAIWSRVLGRDPAREDSFFALGGDSIASVRVVSEALAAGWRLSARDLFRAPVLADLARTAEAVAPDAVAAATSSGAVSNPGSPAVDRADLDDFLEGL